MKLDVYFLILLAGFPIETRCIAASSSSPQRRIVSIKKNGGESRVFDTSPNQALAARSSTSLIYSGLGRRVISAVRSTFLPSGYPQLTPPGYLRYCMFSWVQDMSTQLRSVLATQRVLEGVGVGREGATALSALMNYLVRDGCGMAATLLFTSAASSRFRTDVKRWRIFADIMVDFGITLEVMALLVPRAFFLPMISLGNMCKAMCGVAAGACGGSINLHWAKGSDISDINAKFGAQHTVTGALGLLFAAFFARSVDSVNATILWALYATLTIAHLIANAACMRLIAFDGCNTLRINMLMAEFFQQWDRDTASGAQKSFLQLSHPEQIAGREPLFFGVLVDEDAKGPGQVPIHVGVCFEDFWRARGTDSDDDPLQLQQSESARDNYLVTKTSAAGEPDSIVLVFLSNVTGRQEAKAYFHATWLSKYQERDDADFLQAWESFEKSLGESGWDINKTELATRGYEVTFESLLGKL